MRGVVEEATRKEEVAGSNPISRVARDFTRKNTRLQRLRRRRAAFLRFKYFFPIFIKWRFCVQDSLLLPGFATAIMLNDIGLLWLACSSPSIVVNKNITENT
jgi:hypothetical protein